MPQTDPTEQPPTHVYRSAREAARDALDEEPELAIPGRLVRHRIADAAVDATWPTAFAAGLAAGRAAITATARKAFADRFEQEVDPDGVLDPTERAKRAVSAKSAHYATLALKSAETRRAKAAARKQQETA